MSRKNRREKYEPLDLTPADIQNRNVSSGYLGRTPDEIRRNRERLEREKRDRITRQNNARINGGIDWSLCLVPGCGNELRIFGHLEHQSQWRDHTFRLPLCLDHLFVAFRQAKVAADENLPVCVEANAIVKERRQAKLKSVAEAEKKAHLSRTDGDIYFIRLNGLIKVGWSRIVSDRLRSYGPDVEILCVHPGTRNDETNLHRQLTPARARGREWYEDGPITARFIAEAVERWGAPSKEQYDSWTRPKQIVAGKRYH